MNELKELKTGTVFTAVDKLRQKYTYAFIGMDLSDLENGTGCQYIMLWNHDLKHIMRVEINWFMYRKIEIVKEVDPIIAELYQELNSKVPEHLKHEFQRMVGTFTVTSAKGGNLDVRFSKSK